MIDNGNYPEVQTNNKVTRGTIINMNLAGLQLIESQLKL